MDHFSLLWPPGTLNNPNIGRNQLEPITIRDLGLDYLVQGFAHQPDQQKEIFQVLITLVQDVEVIRYRQDVLAELLDNPQLANSLDTLMPLIDSLSRFSFRVEKNMNTLHEVTWRAGELQGIIQCVQGLGEILGKAAGTLKAEGFRTLHQKILDMQADEMFQRLAKELPGLMTELRTCASVTIGVNLDQLLRPVEATLISVNEEKFTSQSLLSRILGSKVNEKEGISPLHKVPLREVEGPYPFHIDPELGRAYEPLMVPLFEDLSMVIEKTTRPIAKALKSYSEIKGHLFTQLRQDLFFYLGALRFMKRMCGIGLPVCRPEITGKADRICLVEDAYNPNLALNMSKVEQEKDISRQVIRNDIHFGPPGRIFILTGPNQGGKTTYIQGCALIQVLAQAGVFIPGKKAVLSLVDNIYTHFAVEEKPDSNTGRFGDEASRLGDIFQKITPFSLIFLNETFSSTNAGESLYLGQDVLRILKRLGTRCIYSTHLHELAAELDNLNRTIPGDSLILSLVSSPITETHSPAQTGRRSYRIEIRPPMGRSYAAEIAARYGISYEQLESTLKKRGLLDSDE